MDIQGLLNKVRWQHVAILVAILVGLYFTGVLQAFFGSIVMANIEVETKTCRIAGETWSPDTLKCQCPVGQGYEYGPLERGGNGWNCIPLSVSSTATVEKPAAAEAETSKFTAPNVFLGVAIILGAILAAFVIRKKK